jgi:hypothetical protein
VRALKDSPNAAERDLWWAHTGGGGGNFGIISKYLFKTAPSPPQNVYLCTLSVHWKDSTGKLIPYNIFRTLLQRFGEFFARDQVERKYFDLFAIFHLMYVSAGAFNFLLQAEKEQSILDFVEFVFGNDIPYTSHDVHYAKIGLNTKPDAVKMGKQCNTSGSLSATQVVPQKGFKQIVGAAPLISKLPWLYAAQTLNGSGPNLRGKYKSAYMRKPFTEHHIQTLYKWMSGAATPNFVNSTTVAQIDSYGGVINDVHPAATANPNRMSIMKIQFQTYWACQQNDAENLAFLRGLYQELYGPRGPWPNNVTGGCYVNYCDVDLIDWPFLYYQHNYPRLQHVKKTWDPLNTFNHAQSIVGASNNLH